MLEQNRRRQRMTRFMAFMHYVMLLPTYLIFVPLLWVVNKMGRRPAFWRRFGRVMRRTTGMDVAFKGYEPRPQDVFICSYYKSGTNWTMQIAHQIATRGQGEFEHVHDVIPWPDSAPGYAISLHDTTIQSASPTGLRVIKTHLAWEHIPYSPQSRYIAVVRNPKDAFVSSYHFTRDVMFGPMMSSVEDFLEYFLMDDFIFEAWGHFLNSYWQQRGRPNVLFMTYEEMKKDLPGTVQRIAAFMGVSLTEAEFALVCEKSSFAYMKAIDHKFYPGRIMPWSSPNGQMMRRGQSGNSSELLTPAQQQRIENHFRAKLRAMGSDFPYDECFFQS